MELFNAQYWQSPHWTKEYILYLKFKPTQAWWDEVVKINSIIEDKTKWIQPTDMPSWFNPSTNSVRYRLNKDFDQGTRYFRDPATGICFFYEIQL